MFGPLKNGLSGVPLQISRQLLPGPEKQFFIAQRVKAPEAFPEGENSLRCLPTTAYLCRQRNFYYGATSAHQECNTDQ